MILSILGDCGMWNVRFLVKIREFDCKRQKKIRQKMRIMFKRAYKESFWTENRSKMTSEISTTF